MNYEEVSGIVKLLNDVDFSAKQKLIKAFHSLSETVVVIKR